MLDLNIVEQLKTIVSDKEMKVKVLESEIQQLKLAVSIYTVRHKFSITSIVSLKTKEALQS